MSDTDKDSKTEDATEKKLADSQAKGQFAKAPEISMVFTLIAAVSVFSIWGHNISTQLSQTTAGILGHLHEFDVTVEGIEYTLVTALQGVMVLMLPLMTAVAGAAILAEGLQTGFRLTPKALTFSANKLNPVSGFKRIFGMKSLVTFGMDFLKFFAVGGIIFLLLGSIMKNPIFFTPVPINYVGTFLAELLIMMLLRLIVVLAIIALINYLYQIKKNTQDMKMTKEEVKEERKSKEVNQEIKSAQKGMAMRLMNKQMMEDIPTADVIVTNPTHFAIALRYEKGTDKAPIILAKGHQLLALRIKDIAKKSEVPMVENKPVARMLYKFGRVGKPIPLELYQVVAEILAYVYKTHKYYFHRLKARRIKTI